MASTYARRRAIGEYGERLAARELQRAGCAVLDRNWRCREGELDIVARDGGVLVVCEVKSRSSDAYGSAVEAITPEKAARLRRLAELWMVAHRVSAASVRVDVVAVTLRPRGAALVRHLVGMA
jgi:putative endonuclease